MRIASTNPQTLALIAALALPIASGVSAQQMDPPASGITVNGAAQPEPAAMAKGPEIKGIISARRGDTLQVTAADGSNTIIVINAATRIKSASGLFGGNRDKLGAEALLNGLPVTVKTLQGGSALVASQINFRGNDFKTASMIRSGTAQGFAEQTAATQALRGRMGDIDKYNIKDTTNVYFDTGKAALSAKAKADLCSAATGAEAMDNALILVVGYTDSTGSEAFNQTLSEKRAGSVINYLQQACHWKPYRMLTPTGMAASDPLASNDTAAGKAQNRRVSVNVLVSKAVDGQ
jgi:outer membrane protein OmpA-like peptidoglycan-associated protein